ncbi:hypothetical protein PVAND_016247 [Polypedilum vanderplanki]|uniref:Uncharacterized protein n=1 Tax=Polypedilum vanderplanki TaxID=319348 RepID=A0A9J6BEJ7_POLVA|nr:hypothetical protein PVAND_016247 [Polypedilum vanderplanki]
MLTELTDLHNETVDESNKSDIGEKAISIDDTMMKLNSSVIEPDAEIFMTNSTLSEKSIKRKKRQSESTLENSNPESENQDQVTSENDNTLVTDNEISTPSEIPASDI